MYVALCGATDTHTKKEAAEGSRIEMEQAINGKDDNEYYSMRQAKTEHELGAESQDSSNNEKRQTGEIGKEVRAREIVRINRREKDKESHRHSQVVSRQHVEAT